jgi:hypothetical protein
VQQRLTRDVLRRDQLAGDERVEAFRAPRVEVGRRALGDHGPSVEEVVVRLGEVAVDGGRGDGSGLVQFAERVGDAHHVGTPPRQLRLVSVDVVDQQGDPAVGLQRAEKPWCGRVLRERGQVARLVAVHLHRDVVELGRHRLHERPPPVRQDHAVGGTGGEAADLRARVDDRRAERALHGGLHRSREVRPRDAYASRRRRCGHRFIVREQAGRRQLLSG